MSTYQQQLAKCKDTNEDYSNIWRSSVWTIADYEELFEDIDRGYIIQSQEANYFIINPDWEEEEEEYVEYKVYFSPNIDETVEDGCWDYLSCPKRITEEAEIIEWIEENDCCSIDEIELKVEAPINLWDVFKKYNEIDILKSQSVWKIYFGAVLQDIREPNWREEEKEQYKKVCDEEDCDTILDIDTDIMCYMNKQNGDKTLCRECYEDGGYKELDENSDNEDSDEEEEENTCWCEVGEHRVSELDMWKDFADCKNCVSEKEMLERTVDDEEKEEGEWKKKYSKHEFYAWCEVEWDTVGLPQTPGISVTDEEIIKRWCSENGYQIRDDGVYVWDLKEEDSDSEEEEEENTCWGNNKCDRDEFGCCIVCCECRECIKRIKEEHAALEEEE